MPGLVDEELKSLRPGDRLAFKYLKSWTMSTGMRVEWIVLTPERGVCDEKVTDQDPKDGPARVVKLGPLRGLPRGVQGPFHKFQDEPSPEAFKAILRQGDRMTTERLLETGGEKIVPKTVYWGSVESSLDQFFRGTYVTRRVHREEPVATTAVGDVVWVVMDPVQGLSLGSEVAEEHVVGRTRGEGLCVHGSQMAPAAMCNISDVAAAMLLLLPTAGFS
eukprot:6309448-Amphidinium_carterae.4